MKIDKTYSKPSLSLFSICLLVLIAAGVFPEFVLAAGGGHDAAHSPGISTLMWPVVNFSIFAWIMAWVYRTKVVPLLRDRRMQVEKSMQDAAGRLQLADEQLKAGRQKLDQIETLRATVIADLERDGENQSALMAENAQAAARRIGEDAVRRIAGDLRKAKEEVRREVILKAAELARFELQQSLSDDDDARMRSEAVRSVG